MSLFRLPCLQDAGQHLCHRGFAIGASHGNQWQRELGTPVGRQLRQCQPGIGHHPSRQTGLGQFVCRLFALAYGSDCALRLGLGEEVIGVEVFTPQGNKQVAWVDAAGVGMHALESHVTMPMGQALGGAQPRTHVLQGGHVGHVNTSTLGCGTSRPSAIRTWAMSENGRRCPAIS